MIKPSTTMQDRYQQIDQMIKSNHIYRLEQELACTVDDATRERLAMQLAREHGTKTQKEKNDNAMRKHLEVLKDSQYKKRWVMLDMSQRVNRITEYMDRIGLDAGMREQVLACDWVGLDAKQVKYDHIKGTVIELAVLKKDPEGVYVVARVDDVPKVVRKTKVTRNKG
jgi:hypothetical protein